MRRRKKSLRPAGWAWVGLAVYVAAIDSMLLKTKQRRGQPYCSMSEVFGDSLRHPVKRWPVSLAWLTLTLHLFGSLLPGPVWFWEKLDPFHYVVKAIEKA